MLKHIIWDFDGTLFDTYPQLTEVFHKMLKDLDIDEPQEQILENFKISFKHTENYYKKKYDLNLNLEKLYSEYKDKYIKIMNYKPFPYVQEICKKISSNSKYNYLYTHSKLSLSLESLNNYNMENYFTDLITSDNDNFKRKPQPDTILYLMQKYNMNPEETIIIGDRSLDIMAGKNAGIKTCFFDEFNTKKIDYATYTISSIKDLNDIIFK